MRMRWRRSKRTWSTLYNTSWRIRLAIEVKVDSYFVHGTVSHFNRLRNGRYSLTSFNPNPNSIYNLIWESPAHSVHNIVVFKSSDNRENLQFLQFPMKLGSFKYDRD